MKNGDELFEYLNKHYGEDLLSIEGGEIGEKWITIPTEKLKEVAKFMRDDDSLMLDVLMCLSGVHYPDSEELGVTYHTYSTLYKHKLTFKVRVPVKNPAVPSLESIWKTADWHEREAYDMFGIIFENHPNLTRILCPEDWEGYPLRKDYIQQEFYQGITTRE